MFEKLESLTLLVKHIVRFAATKAGGLGHTEVSTEHLLFGMLHEGSGRAILIFKSLCLSVEQMISATDACLQAKNGSLRDEVPLSEDAKEVLNCAIREAELMHGGYAGTDHLLLGLLQVRGGVACQVLNRLGVRFEQVRPIVHEFLTP